MGYKIDETIERAFYDEIGGVEVYFDSIHVSGTSVCGTISISQGISSIDLTDAQAHELREILKRVN